jgi:hypothetical protein
MTMIIPEWWLADAKYPVVVDPVVGSSVVGAYNSYEYITQLDYQRYSKAKSDDPSVLLESYANARPLEFATGAVFNKYTLPARLGWCNTFLYIEKVPIIQNYSYDDYGVVPLLYDDDNNHPKYSLNYESWFASILGLSSPSSFTPQWIQSEITTDGYIAEDTEVWFGHFGRHGAMRFDYGAPFFQTNEYVAQSENTGESDDSFIMAFDGDLYDISYMDDQLSGFNKNVYPGARYDMKVSMYLTYTARYNRTVNQWVMPTEIQQLTGKYQRNAEQTVWGTAYANRFEGFYRWVEDKAVSGGVVLRQLFVFLRLLTGAYIRDYIIGRFLKSKEEVVIKSPVCREIILDSKLH